MPGMGRGKAIPVRHPGQHPAGPEVIRQMENAFLRTGGLLPDRLLTALEAGNLAAGIAASPVG